MEFVPDNVLHNILHRVGRFTRRVYHHWRDIYGPPAGVCFPSTQHSDYNVAPCDHLLRLTTPTASSSHASPLSHIRTVVMDSDCCVIDQVEDLLSCLPQACPTLHSLHVDPLAYLDPEDLIPLAPLAPSLTHLTASLTDAPAVACLAATFTSLHSLALTIPETDDPGTLTEHQQQGTTPLVHAVTALSTTGSLPHLRHLHISMEDGLTWQAAPEILAPLATFSHLTHLAITNQHLAWDKDSLSLLANSWPQLASLSLCLGNLAIQTDPPNPTTPPGFKDLLATIGMRTALTALSLTFAELPGEIDTDRQPLATLSRLASLSLAPRRPRESHNRSSPSWTSSLSQDSPLHCVLASAATAPLTHLMFDLGRAQHHCNYLHNVCRPLSATLASLTLSGSQLPTPEQLIPLMQLTGLQALSLISPLAYDPYCSSKHVSLLADYAAREIFCSLKCLTSLTLVDLPGWSATTLVAVLVAAAANAPLRHLCAELHPDHHDLLLPQLHTCLAPAGTTLTRLSINITSEHVKGVLHALAGSLPALRALVLGVDGVGNSRRSRQGDMLLPPALRLLVVRHSRLLHHGVKNELLAAAALQDCVVQNEVPNAEFDDCNGYPDGAAAEFLQRMATGS